MLAVTVGDCAIYLVTCWKLIYVVLSTQLLLQGMCADETYLTAQGVLVATHCCCLQDTE
jgi:hypothetical protein